MSEQGSVACRQRTTFVAGLAVCVLAVILGSMCNSFIICTAKGYGGFFFSAAMPGGFIMMLSVLPNGVIATLVSRTGQVSSSAEESAQKHAAAIAALESDKQDLEMQISSLKAAQQDELAQLNAEHDKMRADLEAGKKDLVEGDE